MVAPGGLIPKECEVCGGKFSAKRNTARFCSPRCQMRSSRAARRECEVLPERREHAAVVKLADRPASEVNILRVTRDALESVGRLETPMGQASMLIAEILSSGVQDTGSSIAALIRQYDASLTKALDGTASISSALERGRAARERRIA